jgi:PAS domain-containing protein
LKDADKPRRENAVAGIALKSIERVQPLALAEQSQDIEADQQYRWLLDHSPVAMCVHADGRYVYVNQTLVRKMGAQSADQLIGRRGYEPAAGNGDRDP